MNKAQKNQQHCVVDITRILIKILITYPPDFPCSQTLANASVQLHICIQFWGFHFSLFGQRCTDHILTPQTSASPSSQLWVQQETASCCSRRTGAPAHPSSLQLQPQHFPQSSLCLSLLVFSFLSMLLRDRSTLTLLLFVDDEMLILFHASAPRPLAIQ